MPFVVLSYFAAPFRLMKIIIIIYRVANIPARQRILSHMKGLTLIMGMRQRKAEPEHRMPTACFGLNPASRSLR